MVTCGLARNNHTPLCLWQKDCGRNLCGKVTSQKSASFKKKRHLHGKINSQELELLEPVRPVPPQSRCRLSRIFSNKGISWINKNRNFSLPAARRR